MEKPIASIAPIRKTHTKVAWSLLWVPRDLPLFRIFEVSWEFVCINKIEVSLTAIHSEMFSA